ncbi:hypothetical protein TRFO_15541 [Tritrichomonas foetus]|uniref:Uncharacterized protein n=1 Tax=Tritrichomonas foetus TaxID=1144522 RepID=A0A1J4KSJ6_9EUKA|nr:hypothetical protein TRFO_15541 [Tritrichomonas foetus]|eukprot:OHT14235.1 hypothetical protein TRFO_15541 [Tritrichomonas foetus]
MKTKKKQRNDPVIEYAHQIFIDLPVSGIPYNYQKRVLNFLKDQKNQAIKAGDYLSAQKFDDKINEMNLMRTEDTYITSKNGKLEELQQRLVAAQQELEQQREDKNRILDLFQEEREEEITKMYIQLDNELAIFDEEHNTEVPPKFRKFSPEYLNLRKREKFMVSSKRYVEADKLKKEADAREIVERNNQQTNWENYVKKQREILIKKQDEQRRCFIEKWDREWAALLPSAENEVAKYENAVKAIESRIAEFHVTQQVGLDGTATSRNFAITANGSPPTVTTGKTTARNATSRLSTNLPPLNVSPTQSDPLRSRLTYIRATNYNRNRQQKIQKQRGGKRAKSSIH